MSEPADDLRVTTVVRTYQRRDSALRALASACGQTWADRQTIVLVDDGSTDGTAQAAAAAFGSRVRIVRLPENRGAGAAANAGLAAADTPYVAFLDSDDAWAPERLERLVPALDAQPRAALAYSDYRRVVAQGTLDFPVACGPADRLARLAGNPIHSLSLVVARTQAVRALGGFREDLWSSEDRDLYERLYRDGGARRFVHLPAPLAECTAGADNLTSETGRWLDDAMLLLDEAMQADPALRARTASLVERRLESVARATAQGRRQARPPRLDLSVVLLGPAGDAAALRATLASLANQSTLPCEAVLALTGAGLPPLPDVPFPVVGGCALPGEGEGTVFARALAAVRGAVCVTLRVGERLRPDAVAHHVAAHGILPDTTLSYGGTPEVPLPPALEDAMGAEPGAGPGAVPAPAARAFATAVLRRYGLAAVDAPGEALRDLPGGRGRAVRIRAAVAEI